MSADSLPKPRFIQKTYSLGPLQHFRWDKALAAANAIEDEELIRKLKGVSRERRY